MSSDTPSSPKPANAHMEQVFSRDMRDAQAQFLAWLTAQMSDKNDVRLLGFSRPVSSGLSHELISADIGWREGGVDKSRAVMIRLDPVRYRKRRTSNLRREFEVQSILSRLGTVPVPAMYRYETDTSILGAEFYVMERMEGRVLGDPPFIRQGWFFDLSPAERCIAWDNAIVMLAAIHKVPADALGVLRREDDDQSDVEQHSQYWKSSYDWAMAREPAPNPVAEKGWKWLIENKPASYPVGLSWGDAHPRNMMFHGLKPVTVLDWEDVSLSSPLYDLARWFITHRLYGLAGFPPLEGVPSRAETIARWEELTGYKADALHWFELLSCCGGTGALVRTAQIQAELFGTPKSAESKWMPAMNGLIEELLAGGTL